MSKKKRKSGNKLLKYSFERHLRFRNISYFSHTDESNFNLFKAQLAGNMLDTAPALALTLSDSIFIHSHSWNVVAMLQKKCVA